MLEPGVPPHLQENADKEAVDLYKSCRCPMRRNCIR